MPKIKVHEKALAHLSRGLYRSPASALRELVSNAWDANATTVTINTNYPNFYQLSVEDDGIGFNKAAFEQLMQGGIGNSQKRPLDLKLIFLRKWFLNVSCDARRMPGNRIADSFVFGRMYHCC